MEYPKCYFVVEEATMIRYVAALVSLLMFAFGAWAQSGISVQSNLIRGKSNADQIPDDLALRLLLELNLTGDTSALRAPQGQRCLLGLDQPEHYPG
jgi:hypothetical protein